MFYSAEKRPFVMMAGLSRRDDSAAITIRHQHFNWIYFQAERSRFEKYKLTSPCWGKKKKVGVGGGEGVGECLPWMSTDRDCFIPMTKTSSLSHKGTSPVGLRLQTEWNSIFFFQWRVMSKSGNGFYISSVISRASRWASRVFILQTPNLDLPAHVDEGVGVRRCRKCEGIRMNLPPPPSSQTSICELMKKSVHESKPSSVQTGSAWILRWNDKCPFMFDRYERGSLYLERYINYHMI